MSDRWRRVLPWVVVIVLFVGGITALVASGAFSDDRPAASGGELSSPPVPGPRSVPATPVAPSSVPVTTEPATPTDTPSPSASPSPSALPTNLPRLSEINPSYPPTQTLVDKKTGLIVAVYTVQPNDYLSEIAARFQTPVADVYIWSKDTVGPNADLIYKDQQIVVKVLGKL